MEHPHAALVVEDNPDWRESLTQILEAGGRVVVPVSSYGSALGAIRAQPFDLAIVDLRLSPSDEENRDGIALLQETYIHGIPTIVVTGYGTAELTRRAFDEYGVFSFMDKRTFDIRQFEEMVSRAIATRTESPRAPSAADRGKLRELTSRLFKGEVISFSEDELP